MSTLYAILYTTYTMCFKSMLLAFVMLTLVEAIIKSIAHTFPVVRMLAATSLIQLPLKNFKIFFSET